MTEPAREGSGVAPGVAVVNDCREQEGFAANNHGFAEILGACDAAALLRIGDRTLRDWDRRGRLTPVELGRRKLYRTSELPKILESGTPRTNRIIR
jgi:hypothetical protein